MKILLQTLVPKELLRNEKHHIDINYKNLKNLIKDVTLQVASVHEHKDWDITRFERLDSHKFLKKFPERVSMERRFEINAGKRILMEYAKQSNADYVIFFDSDQSMPYLEDWQKVIKMMEKNIDCLHIPVAMREYRDNRPSFASTEKGSLNFYAIKPDRLKGIDLFDITRMWKAFEGSATPYAPDNKLHFALKKKKIKVKAIKDVTTSHEDQNAIFTYANGKVFKNNK